jgi:hypothetical protein
MNSKHGAQHWFLEITLVLTTLTLACLLYRLSMHKFVVLNLFYLPVLLAAFFLGRYRAGALALLGVVLASVATVLDMSSFAGFASPISIGLALATWAAVMGLCAILAGTLCDERAQKLQEVQEAYIGIVEILSRYLSSADPSLQSRSQRVARLSQQIAQVMQMSDREISDIRVAALLQDIENIEVTSRVITRAVGNLSAARRQGDSEVTFHGAEFLQSLGTVVKGALPLLMHRQEHWDPAATPEGNFLVEHLPFGARIIHTACQYDDLCWGKGPQEILPPREALEILRLEEDGEHHPAVIAALERVFCSGSPALSEKPAAAPSTPRPTSTAAV